MIAILRGHLLTCASVGVEHQSCDYFFRCAPVCDRDEGCGNTSWKCGEDETLAVWGHVIRVPKWCGIARRKQRADLAQFKLSARRVHAGNVDMRHAARDLSDDQWSVLDPGLSFPGSTQVHGVPDQPWPRSSGRLRIQVGHLRKRISHPLTAVSAPHMWLCPECWPDQKS